MRSGRSARGNARRLLNSLKRVVLRMMHWPGIRQGKPVLRWPKEMMIKRILRELPIRQIVNKPLTVLRKESPSSSSCQLMAKM